MGKIRYLEHFWHDNAMKTTVNSSYLGLGSFGPLSQQGGEGI